MTLTFIVVLNYFICDDDCMVNKKKVKNVNWLTLIGILFLVTTLVKVFFYLLNSNQKIQTSSREIDSILTKMEEILKRNDKQLNGKVEFSTEGDLWWIDTDKSNIINKLSPEIRMDFKCLPNATSLLEIKKKIGTEVKNVFLKNGYKFNQLNSSKDLDDGQFYDYIQAYEKDNVKCTFVVDPDCSGNVDGPVTQKIYIVCTDHYNDNYEQQAGIAKDLSVKNEVIEIRKRIDSAAYIDVRGRRSGYYIIAKLEPNGHWKKIFAGQDIPPCKDLKENNIPKEIASNCWPVEEGTNN
jgi:hypothetical protein